MTFVAASPMSMMPVGAMSQLSHSNGFSNSYRMDAGSPNMPPSPGVVSGAFKADPGQMQQKMARQRQLQLERRRMAGRHAAVGMAQANQLPPTSCLSKAPGWDRVLENGIDTPGSFAEKAEKAFQDGQRSLIVKTTTSLKPVDENQESENPSVYNSGMASQRKPSNLRRGDTGIDEIEISDAIDSVLLDLPSTFEMGQNQDSPKKMHMSPSGGRNMANDASKGWSLHVEETVAPQPTGTVQKVRELQPEQPTNEGRRWYKPSTWQKSTPKPQPAPTAPTAPITSTDTNVNNGVEVTQISTIGRAGVRTPDSRCDTPNGPGKWNGPGGRRRRPAPQQQQSTNMGALDFDYMDCPGSIMDNVAPMQSAEVSPQREKPRHLRERESTTSIPAITQSHPVTTDVVEAVQVISENHSDFGDRSFDNQNRPMPFHTPAPTVPSSTSFQAASHTPEPQFQSQSSPQQSKRRFRMPFTGSSSRQQQSPEPTVETTMISEFRID